MPDNARGGWRLMEELYRQTPGREPLILGITGDPATPVSHERAQGVAHYVAQAGRGRILQLANGDWSYADGERKADVLLARYPEANLMWARVLAAARLAARLIGDVRVVFTREPARAAIASAGRRILIVFGVATLLVYGATVVAFRRVVGRPVDRLQRTVDRIATGALDARCDVESSDEIGALAQRVNAMADRLQESTGRLRESEAKYRSIFDSAAEGIFRLARDGRLLDANPATARLLGWPGADELLAAPHGPLPQRREGKAAGREAPAISGLQGQRRRCVRPRPRSRGTGRRRTPCGP